MSLLLKKSKFKIKKYYSLFVQYFCLYFLRFYRIIIDGLYQDFENILCIDSIINLIIQMILSCQNINNKKDKDNCKTKIMLRMSIIL